MLAAHSRHTHTGPLGLYSPRDGARLGAAASLEFVVSGGAPLRRRSILGVEERQIQLQAFLFAAAALAVTSTLSAADTAPAEEQCAKGPVAEIPETVRKSVDEQTGIAWYIDRSTTDRLNEDAFYLYAGKKGCDVWLRLRVQSVSDKPINITRLQVKTDNKTFDLGEVRFKRDSDGKSTWQWFDERVTADHLLMLFTVTASKSAAVRVGGGNRNEERAIGEDEKGALKAVLSTYRALGGQI